MELTGKARRFTQGSLVLNVLWPAVHPETLGVYNGRSIIDSTHRITRIFFIFWLFISLPVWGAEPPSIAWGQHYNGLSLGISLKGNEDKPQKVVNIYLWAETTDGRVPPMIDPFSTSLMNYTPQDKSIQKASTNTDTWDKFRWERLSETTSKSKLLKVSSRPSGKWGIEATIPAVWRGKSTELKTGILEYTMK